MISQQKKALPVLAVEPELFAELSLSRKRMKLKEYMNMYIKRRRISPTVTYAKASSEPEPESSRLDGGAHACVVNQA